MSTTEELIEEYQNTLDHMRICDKVYLACEIGNVEGSVESLTSA